MSPAEIKTSKETDGDKKKVSVNISFPLFGYIIRRILIFLPTLFAISLITFIGRDHAQ